MGKRMQDRMVRLFDALVAAPTGLTIYAIGDVLGLDVDEPVSTGRQQAFAVIRALRLKLGELHADPDDKVHGYSIPIRREGTTQYYLLAAKRTEEAIDWQDVRAETLLSRLKVDVAHWQALVFNSDGRTVEGRLARVYLRHTLRLQEDVEEIKAGL
jgi:hypothetical protein